MNKDVDVVIDFASRSRPFKAGWYRAFLMLFYRGRSRLLRGAGQGMVRLGETSRQ